MGGPGREVAGANGVRIIRGAENLRSFVFNNILALFPQKRTYST